MVFQTVRQSVPRSQQAAGPLENSFMKAAVLADDVGDMRIGKEDACGRVAGLLPFDDEEEVLARPNSLERCQGGYAYPQKPSVVMRLAGSLECGMFATTQIDGAGLFRRMKTVERRSVKARNVVFPRI
ncbi:aldehyde dehydrogenase family protein [Bradyrhizobium sp. 25ACV]